MIKRTLDEIWEYTHFGIWCSDPKKYKEIPFDLAYEIRFSRINLGDSWRGVAVHITKGEESNQLLGMDLCKHAMMFFGEEEEDGWN